MESGSYWLDILCELWGEVAWAEKEEIKEMEEEDMGGGRRRRIEVWKTRRRSTRGVLERNGFNIGDGTATPLSPCKLPIKSSSYQTQTWGWCISMSG